MSKDIYIVDIETGPRDREAVLSFFNKDDVKVGNLKDPQKIADKMVEAESEFVDKAPLSAITGEIVCIGIMTPSGERLYLDATDYGIGEKKCLQQFWDAFRPIPNRREIANWALLTFDMPFIIQRSYYWGVEVPEGIMQGRYFDRRFTDLMTMFTCGVYGQYQKLDTVARFLGVGGKEKTNPCEGKNAHTFFRHSDPAKRALAYRYLHNDLIMARRVAERMMGLEPLSNFVMGVGEDK